MSLQQIFRKELEKIQVDNRYISEQVKKGKCVNPSAQYILIIQKDNKDLIERDRPSTRISTKYRIHRKSGLTRNRYKKVDSLPVASVSVVIRFIGDEDKTFFRLDSIPYL